MKCYKAKWILTSEDKVLEDYAIVVDDGKITAIIPNSEVNFEKCKRFGEFSYYTRLY